MKKLLLFGVLATIFGCVADPLTNPLLAPVVSGITMWEDGMAHRYYRENQQVIYRATKLSLKELGHSIQKDEVRKDDTNYLEAGDDDKFKITIRQVKPDITDVGIRINLLGNKPYAELVYEQIELNTNTIEFDTTGHPTKRKGRKHFGQ